MFGSSFSRPPGQSIFGGGTVANTNQQEQQGQQQQQQQGQQQQQQNQQQQQQQQALGGNLGQSQMNPALAGSLWQPGSLVNYQKSIPEQMKTITEKWDPSNPNCVFKTYLYNKVDEHAVPMFGPGPNEDPKEWEEALQHKPAPNYIPVLCAGFPSIVQRLILQRRVISEFNTKLHAINASLDEILSRHDLEHSVRALKARRRHAELSKRCLMLASRVQVLRNKGYALSSDEDDLKQKLQRIDRSIQDPALSARMEELWSRMITLRRYSDNLRDELNKPGVGDSDGLGEEIEARAKKILEDYEKQLQHLKGQVDEAKRDFAEWEKEHNPAPAPSPSPTPVTSAP
ncbi:nucleoporin complex subunit 54-domain-containing protein [Podospora didyma]|uniref:Nucleoporin complex subunit 54-domain-containing protein n=1 Tax=Podospora didyma TaxID=330526 RepID=A0AAE0K923_9PEZI|nr:nucleoporin complex subunit 54-domain-containing protein [Podospora didyma]